MMHTLTCTHITAMYINVFLSFSNYLHTYKKIIFSFFLRAMLLFLYMYKNCLYFEFISFQSVKFMYTKWQQLHPLQTYSSSLLHVLGSYTICSSLLLNCSLVPDLAKLRKYLQIGIGEWQQHYPLQPCSTSSLHFLGGTVIS